MQLSARQFIAIFHRIGEAVEAEQAYLSELDRVIGDGDHGVSMAIGWRAIRERLDQLAEVEEIGAIVQEISRTFLDSVGASVGPLYGMGWMRGSAAVAGKTAVSAEDLGQFWIAVVQGIQKIGKAERGDKTMLDTWIPIAEVLEKDTAWPEAWEEAVKAGREGMESTKDMISRKGRSGRLGDRSKGGIDPGAASAQLIFATFVEAYIACRGVETS